MYEFKIPNLLTMARIDPTQQSLSITVKADKYTMVRFKRLLYMMQHASNVGHSGLFAMSVDGDGIEYIEVDGIDFKSLPEIIEGYQKYGGQDVEIATIDGYKFANLQR